MNDKNCKATLNWYKSCAELATRLNGTRRESYSSSLIDNIKSSSDYYFKGSRRPLSSLSIIQRELGGVVERLIFPPRLTEKFHIKSEAKSDSTAQSSERWAVDPETLTKVIWWLGILTTLLTVVILFILCLYCIQYRKMKQRNTKKEAFDVGEMQRRQDGCECSRRIWDTGEPRRANKPRPIADYDTSDCCESDQELGLRFSVRDDRQPCSNKRSSDQRRVPRTH